MATIDDQSAAGDASMEKLLTAVFMAISVPVAIADEDLRFLTANVRFLKAFGVTPHELAGRKLTDFITPSDQAALAKARAEQSADGRPFEVAGKAARPGAPASQMIARVEIVSQSGFRRIRVITLLEPDPAIKTPSGIVNGELVGLVRTTPAGPVVVAGAIKLIGLDEVRAGLGDRWASHAERVMTIAERIIRRRMLPQDLVSRTDDQGFVICFAGGSEEEAAFRAGSIAREIREFLIGESDDPAAAAVSVVTRALSLEPGDTTDPDSILRVLEERLALAREQAVRLAELDLQRILQEARLEPLRLHDRNGKPTPIAYAALPAPLQGRLDVVAGTLPPARLANLDTELLLLTLASEWALGAVAGIDRNAASESHAPVDVYIVPLDFAIFATRRKQDALNRICRDLPAAVRQRLILSVCNMPRTITQSRIQEIVGQLKSFARGLGLELRHAADAPADLMQSRFALAVISAERLLDADKSQSVRKLITRARAANLRLVARDVSPGQIPALTALGIDYHILDPVAALAPRKTEDAAAKAPNALSRFAVYQAAVDASASGLLVTDPSRPDNPIILANPAFYRMTGYGPDEIVGRNARFLQGAGTDRAVVGEIRHAIEKGEAITRRLLNYRKDGKAFWTEMTVAPVFAEDGRIANFIGIQIDVSEEHRAKSAHRSISTLLERVTETMPGFIFQRTLSPSGRIEFPYLSRSFQRLIGLPADVPMTNEMCRTRIHPDDAEAVEEAIRRSAHSQSGFSSEYRLVRWDGELRWVSTHSTAVVQSNGVTVWNGVAVDITSQKTAEERLSYLGEYDALTGLYNRPKYHTVLRDLARDIALDDRPIAMFAIDIMRFAEINDSFGWAIGDQVIIQIAERLKSLFGPTATLFHLGGDEYAVVDSSIATAEEADRKAQDICAALGRQFTVGDTRLRLDANVGVSVNGNMGLETEGSPGGIARELEKRTELSLEEARRIGPGAHCLYRPDIDDRLRNQELLLQSMAHAIEGQQFHLDYQPMVELATGRIVGAEALVRWNHPLLGIQRPDYFIPLAERSGLILQLGAWVLRDAVLCLRHWHSLGIIRPKVAVNVSFVQLQGDELLAVLDDVLAHGDVDPGQIEFELTESSLVHASDDAIGMLKRIRARGVSIAIDDFGTGHSSFQYLRELPISKLKIDRNFVRQLSPSSSDASTVRAIIGLGKSMGFEVVAEGVETARQRDFLVSEGCLFGQGYYFSPPLAEEDLSGMLLRDEILPRPAGQAKSR
jgi:diguanylate cyclase (GGDEF)-like protein/PAS domain S-box-containing protein